jgi:uncharacterized Rmd1/YagE family protein
VWLKGNAAPHECGAQTGEGTNPEVFDDKAEPDKWVQAGNTSKRSVREDMPARAESQERFGAIRRTMVRSVSVLSKEAFQMNELHRALAPISDEA